MKLGVTNLSVDEYLARIRRKMRKMEKQRSRFKEHTLANKPRKLLAAEFCRELAPIIEARPLGFTLSFDLVDNWFYFDPFVERHRFRELRDELKKYGWRCRFEYRKQRVHFFPKKVDE
jgi:hypothetical protein